MASYAEAIVQTIRHPLLVLDEELRVRSANAAFLRMFEVEEADTVGQFIYDLGASQWDIPRFRRLLEEVLSDDVLVEDYEVEHEFPNIGRKYMILNARRLQQDVVGEELVLLAIEDATEQREARRAIEAYAHDLERSNRDLEQFAYVASHDLQEPLRTVSSFAQLLARRYEGELDEKAQQYIGFMTDAAGRMQRLIRDLLAFSRVTRTEEGYAETPLDVPLTEAISRLSSTIEDSGAQMTHDPLPTLRIQPGLIAQLFQNLIANAIKYRGEAPPAIHVSAEKIDSKWRIDVSDNGPGIDPRYHERIFGIFQRLHAGTHPEGTGIGLALCRRIVEHHGGRIWVESTPGEGATFSFTLEGESP
jgi:light-regulated signal transduction histidine kinase (bacteriophytochrome)